eukprot:6475670-Amphidinium_carterae.1
MFAAASANVRKEQAAVRSNRPRSPAKKPRGPPPGQQQGADSCSLDKGPPRRAPQQPQPHEAAHSGSAGSGGTGSGIPPPPYVRAAARRASAAQQELSTDDETSYYTSSEEAVPVPAKPKPPRTQESSRKETIKPLQQAKQGKGKRGRKARKARQASQQAAVVQPETIELDPVPPPAAKPKPKVPPMGTGDRPRVTLLNKAKTPSTPAKASDPSQAYTPQQGDTVVPPWMSDIRACIELFRIPNGSGVVAFEDLAYLDPTSLSLNPIELAKLKRAASYNGVQLGVF